MLVKEVMTKKVISLKENDSIEKVLKLFTKHNISGAPVIDKNNKVVGIVSESDITKIIDAYSPTIRFDKGNMYEVLLAAIKGKNEFEAIKKSINSNKIKVKEFMNTPVITITADKNLIKAARLMEHYHLNRIPVVNKSGKLIGIISRQDIIRALTK